MKKNNELETLTHPLITPEHLRRKAIVYVRKSSLDHTGTDNQPEQVQLARQYGWPEPLIEVIDEDLGKRGSSMDRTGWQRLLDQVREGGVGAVFATNVSRFARELFEIEKLRMLAADHAALLCVDNRVVDPDNSIG